MSLLLNVSRIGSLPITTLYGGNIAGEWNNFVRDQSYIARFTAFNPNNGAVLGVNNRSWIKPLKGNAISLRVASNSNGAMSAQLARNSTMDSTTTSDGTMNMSVVINSSINGASTSDGTMSAQAILKATINGTTTSSGSMSMSVIMKSSMNGATASNGVMNMKGIMRASLNNVDNTGLTPASIWGYQDRTLTSSGSLTTDEHNKLMSVATKGDVWAAAFV